MKRAADGKVIHRDTCTRAGGAVHWNLADGKTDRDVYRTVTQYAWLRLGPCCFEGTAAELLAAPAAGCRHVHDDACYDAGGAPDCLHVHYAGCGGP